MGFFADRAAKSELQVRDTALVAVKQARPDFKVGKVLLPCHIVLEAHNGFYVQARTGAPVLTVFRCQLHWWAYETDAATVISLRSPDSAKAVARLRGDQPIDIGSIRGGTEIVTMFLGFWLGDRK